MMVMHVSNLLWIVFSLNPTTYTRNSWKLLYPGHDIRICSLIPNYEASYNGKSCRHMKVRVSEHQGVSPRTGKRVKGTLSTLVKDHMLNCYHTVAWEDFSIICRESNHYLLETKESLFIKRDNSSINRNKYSQELFLF